MTPGPSHESRVTSHAGSSPSHKFKFSASAAGPRRTAAYAANDSESRVTDDDRLVTRIMVTVLVTATAATVPPLRPLPIRRDAVAAGPKAGPPADRADSNAESRAIRVPVALTAAATVTVHPGRH